MNEPTNSAFLRGAHLFDDGAFFEAHEAWEVRWRLAGEESERRFLHGLIQCAAALHKLFVMGSPASASRLLVRGLAKLDACEEGREGFDLATFRDALRSCAEALALAKLDRSAVPRMLPALSLPPQSS